MPYVENRTIHDADSHVMEFPEKISEYISAKFQDDFAPYVHKQDAEVAEKVLQLHDDPEYVAGAEDEIMLRRGKSADEVTVGMSREIR